MRKTDLKIGMTPQKLEWLASLCQYDIACLIYFFLILQTSILSTAILVLQGLKKSSGTQNRSEVNITSIHYTHIKAK